MSIRTTAIILSGGWSRRMGFPKALLDFNEKSLICRHIDMFYNVPVQEIIVVTGPLHESITSTACLKNNKNIIVVQNSDYNSDQMGSIRLGLKNSSKFVDIAVLMPVDIPPLPSSLIKNMISELDSSPSNIAAIPFYNNRAGHPVIVKKKAFYDILKKYNTLRDFLLSENRNVLQFKTEIAEVVMNLNDKQKYINYLEQI